MHLKDKITLNCNTSEDVAWFFKQYDSGMMVFNSSLKEFPLALQQYLKLSSIKTRYDGYYYCFGRENENTKPYLSVTQLKVYGKIGLKY